MKMIKSGVNNWVQIMSIILGILVLSFGEIALNDLSKLFKSISRYEVIEKLKSTEEKEVIKSAENAVNELQNEINSNNFRLNSIEEDVRKKKSILDQLLKNEKINPNTETKNLLNTYQKQYLTLQDEASKLKTDIAEDEFELSEKIRRNDNYIRSIEDKYKLQIEKSIKQETRKKEIKVLVAQFLFIAGLFAIGTFLLMRYRNSKYFMPIIGYNIAVYIMIIQAIYIHSPFRLHYYTFIGIGIVLCIWVIIWLLRNIAKLSKNQKLSIVKKSLLNGVCPSCSSSITIESKEDSGGKDKKFKRMIFTILLIGGILFSGSSIAFMFDRSGQFGIETMITSIFSMSLPWIIIYFYLSKAAVFKKENLPDPKEFAHKNCPVCGLNLVKECEKCGEMRHSLLPYCNNCGDMIDVFEIEEEKKV